MTDGINPCTLNILLILLAIISNKHSTKILQSGLAFVMGVMFVYFLLGLGLGWVVESFDFLREIAPMIYILLGILLLGSTIGSNLSFLKNIKNKLGQIIGGIRNKKLDLVSIFIMGVCSSFFEFVCTGQIYLPTIYYISTSNLTGYIGRLVLYNFAFSLPMLLIISFMYFGKSADKVQKLLKDRRIENLVRIVVLSLAIYLLMIGILNLSGIKLLDV